MSFSTRRRLFFLAGTAFAGLFLWAIAGLPEFGAYNGVYGETINRVALEQRHATNLVAAVTFDYRGFDTMGEEYILFAAVIGVTILLRQQRDEEEEAPAHEEEENADTREAPHTSDAARVLGLGLIGPVVLFGIYIVAHGHLSPGGGFQGGVILATAAVIVYLSGEYLTFHRVSPQTVNEVAEATGAGGYVGIGLLALAAGTTFLDNVLPLGTTGTLTSAGTIPLINLCVGLEVGGGFTLILTEFLEQTLLVHEKK